MSSDKKERLIPCPYNKNHQVPKSLMHEHLIYCRHIHVHHNVGQNRSLRTGVCRYDHTHVMLFGEVSYHETETCLKRFPNKYKVAEQSSAQTEAAKSLDQTPAPSLDDKKECGGSPLAVATHDDSEVKKVVNPQFQDSDVKDPNVKDHVAKKPAVKNPGIKEQKVEDRGQTIPKLDAIFLDLREAVGNLKEDLLQDRFLDLGSSVENLKLSLKTDSGNKSVK